MPVSALLLTIQMHLNQTVHHSPPKSALVHHPLKAILSVECRSCDVLNTETAS